jgi:hypothetical protein
MTEQGQSALETAWLILVLLVAVSPLLTRVVSKLLG